MSVIPGNDGPRQHSVLVVEDDAHISAIVCYVLADAGYRVLHAPDGRAALELAQSERPDLILMDLLLPYIDGFTLLARLRAADGSARVPVIVLSGRAGSDDEAAARRAGADDCLAKPFDPDLLLRRIAHHLEHARPVAGAPTS